MSLLKQQTRTRQLPRRLHQTLSSFLGSLSINGPHRLPSSTHTDLSIMERTHRAEAVYHLVDRTKNIFICLSSCLTRSLYCIYSFYLASLSPHCPTASITSSPSSSTPLTYLLKDIWFLLTISLSLSGCLSPVTFSNYLVCRPVNGCYNGREDV